MGRGDTDNPNATQGQVLQILPEYITSEDACHRAKERNRNTKRDTFDISPFAQQHWSLGTTCLQPSRFQEPGDQQEANPRDSSGSSGCPLPSQGKG